MLKNIINALSYLVSLAALSVCGVFFVSYAIAAWGTPSADPPSGSPSNLVLSNSDATLKTVTLSGSNYFYINSYDATYGKFYIDAVNGFQIKLDNDANDSNSAFTINNSSNEEILKIDESGQIMALSTYTPSNDYDLATKSWADAQILASCGVCDCGGGGDGGGGGGDSQVPSAPTDLTATAEAPGGSARVALSWSAATSELPLTGYKIYRDSSLIDTIGDTTSYNDTSVSVGTSYSYEVSAYNADGEGSKSNSDSATADNEKLVFISSASYDGDLGYYYGANSKCNTLASNASLSGTYKAWVYSGNPLYSPYSDSYFTHFNGPYKTVDGAKVADDFSDLSDDALDWPILKTENGGGDVDAYAWTGMGTGNNCNEWRSSSSGQSGSTGWNPATSKSLWERQGDMTCNNNLRIYCFEQ